MVMGKKSVLPGFDGPTAATIGNVSAELNGDLAPSAPFGQFTGFDVDLLVANGGGDFKPCGSPPSRPENQSTSARAGIEISLASLGHFARLV
jgi:hypothetical protein